MVRDICNFYFSFWAIICPFFYLHNSLENENFEKMKKNVWRCHHFTQITKNYDHTVYFSWDMAHDGCNYFSFWAISRRFAPLTCSKNQNFKWNEKTPGVVILHNVSKIMIRWCTVPEIWCVTDGWTDGWKKDTEVGAPPKNYSRANQVYQIHENRLASPYDGR